MKVSESRVDQQEEDAEFAAVFVAHLGQVGGFEILSGFRGDRSQGCERVSRCCSIRGACGLHRGCQVPFDGNEPLWHLQKQEPRAALPVLRDSRLHLLRRGLGVPDLPDRPSPCEDSDKHADNPDEHTSGTDGEAQRCRFIPGVRCRVRHVDEAGQRVNELIELS